MVANHARQICSSSVDASAMKAVHTAKMVINCGYMSPTLHMASKAGAVAPMELQMQRPDGAIALGTSAWHGMKRQTPFMQSLGMKSTAVDDDRCTKHP